MVSFFSLITHFIIHFLRLKIIDGNYFAIKIIDVARSDNNIIKIGKYRK